jgi:hypothetical protein
MGNEPVGVNGTLQGLEDQVEDFSFHPKVNRKPQKNFNQESNIIRIEFKGGSH